MSESIYEYSALNSKGEEISLSEYRGKTLLIVNTASKCGFTPQYDGLQKIYKEYEEQDFIILGFPCDQFAHQEPGTDEEISQFCKINYGVTFPLFSKINVNGKNTHNLYKYLKKELPGTFSQKIKWNFTKFLINSDGVPVKRFSPRVKPEDILKDIVPLLKKRV
ncbi:MAG: glutathione peroxidase [Spirochaetales bacterium]|nr:glutathione peroxidase [Spirochaetales bacterium]